MSLIQNTDHVYEWGRSFLTCHLLDISYYNPPTLLINGWLWQLQSRISGNHQTKEEVKQDIQRDCFQDKVYLAFSTTNLG